MALDFKENFHRINYDIYTGVVESDYWGKQGDTGKGFEVTLWDDGQIFIPTGELLRINCKKPDGKRVWIEGELVGNKYRITLTNQVFVTTGTVLAEFELISQGKSRKSETFVIEARESMKFGAVESETEYGYLEYLIMGIEQFRDESEVMRTAEEQRILNESNRITQEDSRELNEDTRQTAESTRISSEDTRNTNETARIGAESTRASNESTRQTNETGRVSAESTRVSQENTRKSQETARVSVESSRVTAESGRVTAENTRVSQENTRKTNETARQTAESARASAESSREDAETLREDSEDIRIINEDDRIASETLRKSNETTRKSNETSRVNVESARVTAESGRASAESTRVSNENTRKSNENTRKSNETARINAESTRVTQENDRLENEGDATSGRIKAENDRVSAESTRASNESTRQTNETARVSAENTRITQETSRVNAEGNATKGRVKAENLRVSAESGRASAESTRVSNESTRQTNETSRQTAESERATAETNRASAESTRVSQENTRKTSETGRVNAESSRASAESARVTAESTRSSQESTRQSNESTRVSNESTRQSQEATRQSQESTRQTNTSIALANMEDAVESTVVIWKEAVSTYSAIATTYPNPEIGWRVEAIDTKKAYRYDGTSWVNISDSSLTFTPENSANKGQPSGYAPLDANSKVPSANLPPLNYIPTSEKGVASGVATLGTDGKVPSTQLPPLDYAPSSHTHSIANVTGLQSALNGKVDDSQVLTNVPAGAKFTDTVYTHPSTHPATMITEDTSHKFVTDAQISTWNAKGTSNLALGTTSSTAFRGDYGNTAYTHSQSAHAPSNANYYAHPSTHPATMITEDSSHRFVTDAEKTTWNTVQNMATFDELHTFQSHVSETYVEISALLNMVYPVGSLYMSTGSTSPSVLFGGTWVAIEDRFLLASSSSFQTGTTGGSMTKTLATANLPSHSHTINHDHASATTSSADLAHTHSVSGTSGSGGVAHTHSVSGTTANGGVAHTHSIPALSGTAASAGSHSHSTRYKGFALTASTNGWMVLRRNESGDGYDGTDSDGAIAAGAHTHSVSTVANKTGGASAYSHSHTFSVTSGAASAHAHTHSFSATSGAMSKNATHSHTLNLPAYSGNSGSSGSGTAFDIMPPYFVVNVWRRTA